MSHGAIGIVYKLIRLLKLGFGQSVQIVKPVHAEVVVIQGVHQAVRQSVNILKGPHHAA